MYRLHRLAKFTIKIKNNFINFAKLKEIKIYVLYPLPLSKKYEIYTIIILLMCHKYIVYMFICLESIENKITQNQRYSFIIHKQNAEINNVQIIFKNAFRQISQSKNYILKYIKIILLSLQVEFSYVFYESIPYNISTYLYVN